MKLPPLRLHYYGIRGRIIFCVLAVLAIFFSPYLLGFEKVDVYSVLLFFLMVLMFSFGLHEYHTTSQSYLSLRNHRRHFFLSSTILGACLSVLAMLVAMGYFFFYEGPLDTKTLISIIVFPTLVNFFIYFFGCLFALIFNRRWIQLSLLGLVLVLITLFYKPIWASRNDLQALLIALPSYYVDTIAFYILIGMVIVPTVIVAVLNYVLYTKKR